MYPGGRRNIKMSSTSIGKREFPYPGKTFFIQGPVLYLPSFSFITSGYLLKIIWILQEADSDPTGEAAQKTQQMLTYYELDLGLNHVVRKYSEQLEEHANFLIAGEPWYHHSFTKKLASEWYLASEYSDANIQVPTSL